jgi:hypothetical protein
MTPYKQKPSMHDIMTNYWIPNSTDTGAHLHSGFGATVAIIGGSDECQAHETHASVARRTNYSWFLA